MYPLLLNSPSTLILFGCGFRARGCCSFFMADRVLLGALSDLKGGGKGLILGLCVAFIGLAVDNLIRTWAEKRKKLLGFKEI